MPFPGNLKSAHQLIPNTRAGMLVWSVGGAHVAEDLVAEPKGLRPAVHQHNDRHRGSRRDRLLHHSQTLSGTKHVAVKVRHQPKTDTSVCFGTGWRLAGVGWCLVGGTHKQCQLPAGQVK